MTYTVDQNYQSKARIPDDFDQFWDSVNTEASRIPLEPEVIPEPMRSTNEIEVFQVFYNSLDNVRIAGWYCIPREKTAPLAAVMVVPGYLGDPAINKEWAKRGYATLSVAPRGKLRSKQQFNPGYPGLLTYGIVDRNIYAYKGFYVDACRGIAFLCSRDEVDVDRIGVTGSSQGGGLTIITAAMCSEIKAAAAGAPYLTGFMDSIELTHTYPYQEINDYLRLYPDSRGHVEETLNYFDAINFAHKVTCPIIVNIAMQDNVCPPETGFALFNNIGSTDKTLYPYEGQGHNGGRFEHTDVIAAFFAKHLGD